MDGNSDRPEQLDCMLPRPEAEQITSSDQATVLRRHDLSQPPAEARHRHRSPDQIQLGRNRAVSSKTTASILLPQDRGTWNAGLMNRGVGDYSPTCSSLRAVRQKKIRHQFNREKSNEMIEAMKERPNKHIQPTSAHSRRSMMRRSASNLPRFGRGNVACFLPCTLRIRQFMLCAWRPAAHACDSQVRTPRTAKAVRVEPACGDPEHTAQKLTTQPER